MLFLTFKEKDCSQLKGIIDAFQGKPINELYQKLVSLGNYIAKKVSHKHSISEGVSWIFN